MSPRTPMDFVMRDLPEPHTEWIVLTFRFSALTPPNIIPHPRRSTPRPPDPPEPR